MVEGGPDDFARALERFVASPEERRRLADGALATRAELLLETMVAAFDGDVRRALGVEDGS